MEMHAQHVLISVQLLASLLHFIIVSVFALMVSAVQIQIMDCLNEGWSLYTMYICMIEPGKDIRFSSSVKHLHNMHLSAPSPQIHNTLDGLLMVAQRKGALNIHCILARFMHI